MKRLIAAAAVIAFAAAVGHADSKKKRPPTTAQQVGETFERALTSVPTRPRFAFTLFDAMVDPGADKQEDLTTDFEMGFTATRSTVAIAADGKSAWIAADMGAITVPCGDESCPRTPRPDTWYHGTALFDGRGPWTPVVWHADMPVSAKDQAQILARGASPTVIPRRVLAGAEAAVALFESSIGDPKALARTVSARTDVVLYGSEMKERYVGGKKVAAQLARWNLTFKLRDGLQAGLSASGSVAWIAANVDAVPAKKPTAKPTPYRALFLYEKYDGVWQVVLAHFSFVP